MSNDKSIFQNLEQKWEEIKRTVMIDSGITDVSFETWIAPLILHRLENNQVYILIPSDTSFQQNYIEKHYTDFFKAAISNELGYLINVVFLLKKDAEKEEGRSDHLNGLDDKIENDSAFHHENEEEGGKGSNLNQKYRFETFVVGSNNKFAYSAALAVAESPGEAYNPLFLYGGPGLGKTHLMHSIGHFVLDHMPDKKVLYVTSEQFTNEVIDSIRSGKQDTKIMSRFREKYRTVDVLLVDDVQFIIGKESTQEEFFHTFNELHQAGKQIVISSDRPPKEMETLDERFRSRFEMGLISDIQPPDYETRMAILKKLGENYPQKIDDAVFSYIATNMKSNIRELEGAYNKIIAFSRLNNVAVTEEITKEALKDVIYPDQSRIITIQTVIDAVCEHYNLRKTDILSKKRNAEIVRPRQIVMYLARTYTNTTLNEIAQALGGKDHSTVMNGVDRIEQMLKKDAELSRNVDIIVKKLNPTP